ncbi:MAG TPA: hypothetical protein VM094_02065 [Gemmatimonadales bacterium]|nr:hypothetical protein [Gemmatimonadales bacterium]
MRPRIVARYFRSVSAGSTSAYRSTSRLALSTEKTPAVCPFVVRNRRGGTMTSRMPHRAASWIRPSSARGSSDCIAADAGPLQ